MTIPPSRRAPYPFPCHALTTGSVPAGEGAHLLSVVDCGELALTSGKLVACDPFAAMLGDGTDAYITVPKGRHPVKVTLADVSAEHDGSHVREAYMSLLLAEGPAVTYEQLALLADGESPEPLEAGEIWGFAVDAGTACFVDKDSLEQDMPAPATWTQLFDDGTPQSWFSRMDDPAHIREGIANIALPGGSGESNVVLTHTGWGDGLYPLIGAFDADGNLVAVHMDFLLFNDD
jgi:hypothetical protein